MKTLTPAQRAVIETPAASLGLRADFTYQFAGYPSYTVYASNPQANPAEQVDNSSAPQLPAEAQLPAIFNVTDFNPSVLLQSNTQYRLAAGKAYNVSSISFAGLHDVWFTGVGPGSKPVVNGILPNSNIFIFDSGSSRIQLGDFVVTSGSVPAVDQGSSYPFQQSSTAFGNVHGSDITIDDIDLGTLSRGIAAIGVQRLAITDCKQLAPGTIQSQVTYFSGCTDVIERRNVWLDSVDESDDRTTSTGAAPDDGCQRYLADSCTFGMTVDPAHGRTLNKAAFTFRSGRDVTIRNCNVSGGELSIQCDETGKQTITNVLIDGGQITGSKLNLGAGASNVVVRGLTINNQTGSECVSDSSVAGAGIVYDALKLNGANCGIKSYGAGTFTYKNLSWTSSNGPSMPIVKGDLTNAVNGGGNVSAV